MKLLFLHGAYLLRGAHPPVFCPVAGSDANELQRLVEQIASRVGLVLERHGPIERDLEKAWLASDDEAGLLDDLIGHSITYRIAVTPKAGLLGHRHEIAAYCPRCDRWRVLPLAELVAHGHGARRLRFTVRCRDCGEVGRLQVRPPVPTRPDSVGWISVPAR